MHVPPAGGDAGRVNPAKKARVVRRLQKWGANPFVRVLSRLGIARGYAVIETIGRTTGKRRRVPVANGLEGDRFWVVAEHGRRADWVRNAEANPRVRVCIRGRWRDGVATLLDDDDTSARFGTGVPKWNERFVRALGTDLLTVRIDLDSS